MNKLIFCFNPLRKLYAPCHVYLFLINYYQAICWELHLSFLRSKDGGCCRRKLQCVKPLINVSQPYLPNQVADQGGMNFGLRPWQSGNPWVTLALTYPTQGKSEMPLNAAQQ